MSKENSIEAKELSDLLRLIEFKVMKSEPTNPIFESAKSELISELQHVAKMGFDIGKNGVTQFEIGE